jgi:hypothetical protein
MANTIKFRPTQDLTVRKSSSGNSSIIRVMDDSLLNKGIDLTAKSGGLFNLTITADSPAILTAEEGFTINAGDELTLIVAEVSAVKQGDDIGNGQVASLDRAAFKQFRIIGYTPLTQILALKKAQHQLALMEQQLANAKAITQATIEGIKSGKIQSQKATAEDFTMIDKW